MPIIETVKLLKDARANHYAVGAFNIDNLDMAKAVIEAAEQRKQPVIIQTTYTTVNHGSAAAYAGMINGMASESTAEIALHLDHGNSYEICAKAIDNHYTSVMIDGSSLPLYRNIDITKQVVDYAKLKGISVEGELGRVGGIEDEVEFSDTVYTDVNECIEFVNKTGIDFIAIGVGTAHGIYNRVPNVNILRIQEIYEAVSIPLVLHGASGLSEEIIRDSIKSGISKINFATEVRMAYTEGVREALNEDAKLFDPKKFQMAGRIRVRELVLYKMRLLNN